MCKFRNVVVNQYEEVDASIVINILQKHLGDFDRFKDAVLKALAAENRELLSSSGSGPDRDFLSGAKT